MLTQNKNVRALFVLRAQPFHNAHLKIIELIGQEFKEIILGIGSAQISYTKENPFTCRERMEMIWEVAKKHDKKYFLIPLPDIEHNYLWVKWVEELTLPFSVVFSNNKLVELLFKREGYEVRNVEWIKDEEIGIISGTKIRELIAKGDGRWKRLVPKEVELKILEFDGVERIRKLFTP